MADEALQVPAEAADGVGMPEITAVASGPVAPAPKMPGAEQEHEEEPVRASGHQAEAHVMSDENEARIASLPDKGALLPESVRGAMERGFGADFTRVRIHTEPAASETAQALGAHAYTYRNSIVFAPGRYSPETSAGKRLLAHELAHVVQQARTPLSQTAQLQRGRRRGRRHLSPAEAESRANNAAANMSAFLSQNILFDFWGGDLRDNDKNGVVDGFRPGVTPLTRGPDRKETDSKDGDYPSGTFRGFRTWSGLTITGGEGGPPVTTIDFNTSTPGRYRVCAGLVSAAYRAASIPVPKTRRVRASRGKMMFREQEKLQLQRRFRQSLDSDAPWVGFLHLGGDWSGRGAQ